MGSGSNSGNFLNPKNLIPAVLTGGLSYVASSYARNAKPQAPPNPPPPPDPGAMPHAMDSNPAETAAQRQKKLAAMQFGYASTITNKPGLGSASLSTPTATPLKAKLGQ